MGNNYIRNQEMVDSSSLIVFDQQENWNHNTRCIQNYIQKKTKTRLAFNLMAHWLKSLSVLCVQMNIVICLVQAQLCLGPVDWR